MPKTIRIPVGFGASRSPQDVMTVQYLLNCVPAGQGGPSPELAVDGVAGPKTIAAIRGFQRTFMPFPDGRVDPGGQTLARLQRFDPYPNQPMPAAQAFPKSGAGSKQGAGHWGSKQGFGPAGSKQGYGPAGVKQGFGPPGYKGGGVQPAGFKDAAGPAGIKQGFGPPGKSSGLKNPGGIKSGW
ncbi:MAG: peptidoglycan-binding protein [Bryobacteraceae bacterium]|nr:peptidoglycan-binding protein [Bryobacteraceae bacterium]